MSDNTLVTQITGTTITVDGVNQYKTALDGDIVPRSTAGLATTLEGSLGTSSLEWLRANIASGYFNIGDIKMHHSYNGAAPVAQGWFPCNNTIINETNYNAIHGAGAWAVYIISSALDGKYAPDFTGNTHPTGVAATTKDGTTSISKVGNTSSEIDLQHLHTMNDHTHKWYDEVATVTSPDRTFDSAGNAVTLPISVVGKTSGYGITTGTVNTISDGYTSSVSQSTDNELSTSQNIEPQSTEVVFYIRII